MRRSQQAGAGFGFLGEDLTAGVSSLVVKEAELGRLRAAHSASVGRLIARERELSGYAQGLLRRRDGLARAQRKWERRLAQSQAACEREERALAALAAPGRGAQLERGRRELGLQIERLAQSLECVAAMHRQCDARIAALAAAGGDARIAELQRRIARARSGVRDAESRSRQTCARITVFGEECEKLQSLRSGVRSSVDAREAALAKLRADHERLLQKSQRRIDESGARAAEIMAKRAKIRSKRSAAKLAIRQLTKKIAEMEETEENVRNEAHKKVSAIAIVTADVNCIKLKTVEVKQDGAEVHDGELAAAEKRNSCEKRIAQLQTEITQTKDETRDILFRAEKIKADLDQQKEKLADDEIRIQDFHEIMDEIDSSERDYVRLEERWRDMQTESLDLELRAIDVGRERGEIMDRVHALKVELNEEQAKISVLTDRLSSVSRVAEAQHTGVSQIEHRKRKLVTIRNSLYAPNRNSPQGWQSSKVIRGELETRAESRKRKLTQLQKKIEKLEDQATELSARNSQRRMKAQRKELTLQQRIQMSKEIASSGVAEEKFIGLNSVQDFRRLLQDEIHSWEGLRSPKVAPLLNSWERKINELFEVLDSYYLQ